MNGIPGDLQGFIMRLGFLEYGHRPAPKWSLAGRTPKI